MDATDDELWRACQKGDINALGELFDRHARRIHTYSSRILFVAQDADDALSETFLEAWRSRKSFSVNKGSALPILLAIAKRMAQRRNRSAQRHLARVKRLTLLETDSQVEDVAQGAADADQLEARRQWLRERVEQLPVGERNVFHLCIYAELSPHEAAKILNIPVGTVKSRLSRARSALLNLHVAVASRE
jgi:RNA polymerase sigma factor (sigma-70 family)